MARPQKNNADYFSHDNDMRDDERIKAVRRKFSHLGYSMWNMLLEKLCRAENFRIEYTEDSRDLMAGDFNIEPEQLKEIIEYLIKLKLIIQEDQIIFSQTMINRFEGLFRKRKRDAERLSLTITKPETIVADENAHSIVKDSIVNNTKEKKIKEKGNKEKHAPVFLNSFSKEKTITTGKEKSNIESPEEKSSAKKEITFIFLSECQEIFEHFSPHYVWEAKDKDQLTQLLQKICITRSKLTTEKEIAETFFNFLQKLPVYWKTKKFTIPHLNYNYNEIVSEIRAIKKNPQTKTQNIKSTTTTKPPEIKQEPTPQEKEKIRKEFVNSICECYKKYVATGLYGYQSLSFMYDTLVQEKVLKLNSAKQKKYQTQAIDLRKAELRNPKHPNESREFKSILQNFNEEIKKGNEKIKLEIALKNLAVLGLFNELKKNKTELKTLFKK